RNRVPTGARTDRAAYADHRFGERGERKALGQAHPALELRGFRLTELGRQVAPARALVGGVDPDDAVEAPGTRDETAVELLGVVGGGEIEHVIAARRFWPRTCTARARRRRRHGLDLPARHESTARRTA